MTQASTQPVSDPRFLGFAQLVGNRVYEHVNQAHVCVIGLGGVGSWTVETLTRSGIGKLTLVDLDEVCISNVNRQIQALESTVGRPKVDALAERIASINPRCVVNKIERFVTAATLDEVLSGNYSCVVDAIDRVTNKCLLLAACREKKIPVVSVGSAGGHLEPSRLKVSDLAFTEYDPLLAQVRKKLRQDHNFPRRVKDSFGIPCVYAPLQVREESLSNEAQSCEVGTKRNGTSCNDGLGTAAFVTAAFGCFAAAEVVKVLKTQATSTLNAI